MFNWIKNKKSSSNKKQIIKHLESAIKILEKDRDRLKSVLYSQDIFTREQVLHLCDRHHFLELLYSLLEINRYCVVKKVNINFIGDLSVTYELHKKAEKRDAEVFKKNKGNLQ